MKEYVKAFSFELGLLLDKEQYDEAKHRLNSELEKYKAEEPKSPFLLAEIAGLYIDIASENWDNDAATKGVEILEANASLFKGYVSDESYFYCLGNGKEAIYKIGNYKKGLPTLEVIKPHLIEAKNCFQKAFKEGEGAAHSLFRNKILTNLGGNLAQTGRIIETIRLYQTVLAKDPLFPQALIGLAENLDYWSEVSGCGHTKALYSLIYKNYEAGLMQGNMPSAVMQRMLYKYELYKQKLNYHEIDISSIDKDISETRQEYKQHTKYRRFCIDNFLTLNEHAIYCPCVAAINDDLSIGHEEIAIAGEKAPKMELLLNRLKSEFGLARKLFYESGNEVTNDEILYNDLGDNEIINENTEKLRTAFKMCFGIFDKIAHGLCFFYDLKSKPTENIYFNTFWENNKMRWEKIKTMRNPHLAALYSIGNDLNIKEGEFGFYKEWRNAMEHNLIILTNDDYYMDPLQIFSNPEFVQTVSFSYFQSQVLLLLQLCRSAIFSFTYCIRIETVREVPENSTPSYIVKPKEK